MTKVLIDKSLLDQLVASVEPYSPPSVVPATPSIPEVTSTMLAWGSKVSKVFRDRVRWIGDNLKIDPNFLMACMAWESGETFSAGIVNKAGSGATGLIQFMPTTAKELGTTTAALAVMTAEDQLNFVYKYFVVQIKRHGPLVTLEDVYMAILWPSAIGESSGYILFDKSKKPTAYRQNAGLDLNKDDRITKYEAASHVRVKLEKGLKLAA